MSEGEQKEVTVYEQTLRMYIPFGWKIPELKESQESMVNNTVSAIMDRDSSTHKDALVEFKASTPSNIWPFVHAEVAQRLHDLKQKEEKKEE